MAFKFEKLAVWEGSVACIDQIYAIAEGLPRAEAFNLNQQITRAATSIALNVAEGSTGQSDQEPARFLGYALRSLIETVACLHLIRRRSYLSDPAPLRDAYRAAERLARQLQAFRGSLGSGVREPATAYTTDGPSPL